VVFDFRLGREREGPSGSWATSKAYCKATIAALTIISVAQGSSTPRAGRMARRKFFDAIKLNPKDTTSIQIEL
jgi:hypothetical protein